MSLLEVHSVAKSFGSTPVLLDVSFVVEEGEIICLLGPSGCGKTTLLRIIAGLETADEGQVLLDDRELDVPPHQRGFGLMFQDYALFPHKDVAANVAFGLRMQGLPSAQVKSRIAEVLELVGLTGYEHRRVYDLSGGEQQRVALARSLAPRPRLLMLDEPLGSLDRALREELMVELRVILLRVGVTAVYVTHDQQEAFALADRLILMNRGRIVQQGVPQEVYRQPASTWAARFLGLTNLMPGRVVVSSPLQVETPLGRFGVQGFSLAMPGAPVAVGQEVTVLIRPEGARLAAGCPEGDISCLPGVLQEISFRGGHYRLVMRHASGLELTFELVTTAAEAPRPGEPISLAVQPEAISLLLTED